MAEYGAADQCIHGDNFIGLIALFILPNDKKKFPFRRPTITPDLERNMSTMSYLCLRLIRHIVLNEQDLV